MIISSTIISYALSVNTPEGPLHSKKIVLSTLGHFLAKFAGVNTVIVVIPFPSVFSIPEITIFLAESSIDASGSAI